MFKKKRGMINAPTSIKNNLSILVDKGSASMSYSWSLWNSTNWPTILQKLNKLKQIIVKIVVCMAQIPSENNYLTFSDFKVKKSAGT